MPIKITGSDLYRKASKVAQSAEVKKGRSRTKQRIMTWIKVKSAIHGKTCWKVAFTYGGQLCFHFGRKIAYEHPKLANQFKGEWILNTCGTEWSVQTPSGWVTSSFDEKAAQSRLKVLEGHRITRFSQLHSWLIVEFGKSFTLFVCPSVRDTKYDVPYWELYAPGHLVCSIGQRKTVTCRRSDLLM